MKKIIISLVLVIAVASVASVATYAVWSASTQITGNTISTATVSLGKTGLIEKPIGGPDATNMLPGQYTLPGQAGIYNTSSVSLKLFMATANLSNNDPNGICAHTLLSVYTGHAGTDPVTDTDGKIVSGNDNEAKRHIATKSVLEWSTPPAVEITGVPPFASAGPNITQIIWQQAQLNPSADNFASGEDMYMG